MRQAQQAVHDSGFVYKKGKSRSTFLESSDPEVSEKPKRPRYDKEMREHRMKALGEDIEAYEQCITFKEKRLQKA